MFSNLRAEMARYGVSMLDVANVIGRSDKGTSDKIAGRTTFSIQEAMAVRDRFFSGYTLEYLFAEAGDTAENA